MEKKITNKFLILLPTIALILVSISPTYALGFVDDEVSRGNELSSDILDLGIRSGQGNFVTDSEELARGDSVARDIYIQNIGDMDFAYRVMYEFVSGNEDLCNVLELRVTYNWYDSRGVKHGEQKYSGLLKDFDDFDTNSSSHDPELEIENMHDYHSNPFYADNEHWLYFWVKVPEDADPELSSASCVFDIKTIAWQTNFDDESQGFWDEETIESTIGTSDWAPKVKIESPEDSEVVWGELDVNGTVLDVNPHHYWLVIKNSSGSNVAGPGTVNETSSFENMKLFEWDTTLIPNGVYTIKLEARDAAGNKDPDLAPIPSDPEDPQDSVDWIDVTIDNGEEGSEGDVVINEIMWMGSTESSADEWIELFNRTSSDISLKRWKLENAGEGSDLNLPEDAVIPAGGYFLISNFDKDDSDSALDVDVDWETGDVGFDNSGEQIKLIDGFGNEIDRTPTGSWEDGEDSAQKRSMERNDTPGDGDDWDDWHTCTDAVCNDETYWDAEADNYGTPGLENHSEGDSTDDDDEDEVEETGSVPEVDAVSPEDFGVEPTPEPEVEPEDPGDVEEEGEEGIENEEE